MSQPRSSSRRNPARAALLSVAYLDPVLPARFDLQVCVPPGDNPDLNGGVEPTDTQLQNDGTGRVQPTLSGLDAACNYPPVCACNFVANTARHAYQCNTSCTPTPVDQQCTNFDPNNGHVEANAAGMDPPVCTVFSPLAADLFGQRTSCAVDGTGHIPVSSGGDTDSEDSHATGVVQFVGKPCLGQPNCAVGMTYSLDFADVKVGNFFESATFNKLAGLGESAAGNPAPLSPAGDGTFAPQALGASAQGRRDTNHLQGLATTNDDPVQVTVGWGQSQPTCSLHGTLIGSGDPELK